MSNDKFVTVEHQRARDTILAAALLRHAEIAHSRTRLDTAAQIGGLFDIGAGVTADYADYFTLWQAEVLLGPRAELSDESGTRLAVATGRPAGPVGALFWAAAAISRTSFFIVMKHFARFWTIENQDGDASWLERRLRFCDRLPRLLSPMRASWWDAGPKTRELDDFVELRHHRYAYDIDGKRIVREVSVADAHEFGTRPESIRRVIRSYSVRSFGSSIMPSRGILEQRTDQSGIFELTQPELPESFCCSPPSESLRGRNNHDVESVVVDVVSVSGPSSARLLQASALDENQSGTRFITA